MKLVDFLVREATVEELQAVEKEEAIRELMNRLVEVGELTKRNAAAVTKAIIFSPG